MPSIMSRINGWLKTQARHQATDMKGVRPELRLVNGAYYLNSAAGQLTYRPPTVKDLTRFRDKHVNAFEMLAQMAKAGADVRDELFVLYRDIRTTCKKARWSANAHTRLKAALHVLGKSRG